MRVRCAVFIVSAALSACSKAREPELAPLEAPTSAVQEEHVVVPKHPTPAFVPPENGMCMRAYRLVDGTCVHRFYEQTNPTGLERALAAYKRGVAPPMLGPVPLPPALERRPSTTLDPGALTKRGAEADAGSARERRLSDLDMMLAAAREKLRQRDEASKAKHVDNRRKEAPPQAPDSHGTGAGGTSATETRMNELSWIASQLSGDQLRQLAAELNRTGVNTSALQPMLKQSE